MDTWVNKNIAPSFARMYFEHVAEGFSFIISLFLVNCFSDGIIIHISATIHRVCVQAVSGSGTQMKYFLTSPDINEQKPPWLASPGPGEARIMTISVRLLGLGHWDLGLGTWH